MPTTEKLFIEASCVIDENEKSRQLRRRRQNDGQLSQDALTSRVYVLLDEISGQEHTELRLGMT